MITLSSYWTIIYKFYLPAFALTFLFLLALAITLVAQAPPVFGLGRTGLMVLSWSLFGVAALIYLWGGLSLKRVEADAEYLYATNFKKYYRYPWSNVSRVAFKQRGAFTVGWVTLREPGAFGERFHFLADNRRVQAYLEAHPDKKIVVLA